MEGVERLSPPTAAGYGAAVEALARVIGQDRARTDAVRRAVTAVLGSIGARRLRDALAGDPERIGDRRILQAAAELEEAANAVDDLPNTGGKVSPHRRDAWSIVVHRAGTLRHVLTEERAAQAR